MGIIFSIFGSNLDEKLISVVMPVWNTRPELLSASIGSILSQTHSELELLVIYQKSFQDIDKEMEHVFEDNSDDHRLKIINSDKKGFTYSLNLGLGQARGELIARMDGDDISEKTRFEEQIQYLKDSKSDLNGTWAYSISDDGTLIGKIEYPTTHFEIRKKFMFHNPFLHPSIIFKKQILSKNVFYNSEFEGAEDYDFYCRVIHAGYQVSNTPKYLIRLRETVDSVMRGKAWREKRSVYLKVKKNAIKNLGFNTMMDRFYYLMTPLTFFVSPPMAFKLKRLVGYNKKL